MLVGTAGFQQIMIKDMENVGWLTWILADKAKNTCKCWIWHTWILTVSRLHVQKRGNCKSDSYVKILSGQ